MYLLIFLAGRETNKRLATIETKWTRVDLHYRWLYSRIHSGRLFPCFCDAIRLHKWSKFNVPDKPTRKNTFLFFFLNLILPYFVLDLCFERPQRDGISRGSVFRFVSCGRSRCWDLNVSSEHYFYQRRP